MRERGLNAPKTPIKFGTQRKPKTGQDLRIASHLPCMRSVYLVENKFFRRFLEDFSLIKPKKMPKNLQRICKESAKISQNQPKFYEQK
jgi:hypothetical protein